MVVALHPAIHSCSRTTPSVELAVDPMQLFTASDLAIALVLWVRSAIASRLLAGKTLLKATIKNLVSRRCELRSVGAASSYTCISTRFADQAAEMLSYTRDQALVRHVQEGNDREHGSWEWLTTEWKSV